MTDYPPPEDVPDPTADTGRFQAFAHAGPEDPPRRVGVPFRLLTLLAGLLVLAGLVWLLLFL